MAITDWPSSERPREKLMTQVLKTALTLVDALVLDHFIVAGNHTLSSSERGLL